MDPFLRGWWERQRRREGESQLKVDELGDGRCVAVGTTQYFVACKQVQAVIRYPLLLGGNESLEAGRDAEAQLVEERRL